MARGKQKAIASAERPATLDKAAPATVRSRFAPADVGEVAPPRANEKPLDGIAKVSHTLHSPVAWRLRRFAFHQRVSESAVIEFALQQFFGMGREAALGSLLRQNGAARRRRQPQMFVPPLSGGRRSTDPSSRPAGTSRRESDRK